MPEYEAWKESLGNATTAWDIKYYKGLGTSTKEEAQEYFSRLDLHRKEFVWEGEWVGGRANELFAWRFRLAAPLNRGIVDTPRHVCPAKLRPRVNCARHGKARRQLCGLGNHVLVCAL